MLHHLAEPTRGWAALLRLLKPGGFMRIGLYSELGRTNIVALRKIIAERGYKATPEDIRRSRRDMKDVARGGEDHRANGREREERVELAAIELVLGEVAAREQRREPARRGTG